MAKNDISKRQQQILDFINEYVAIHKVPPSMREISSGVGLSSPSTVHVHLKVLEEKGYIKREGAKSRSMQVVASDADITTGNAEHLKDASSVTLPLVGNVAAGSPILAEENIEEQFTLPTSLVGMNSTFMLKVRGESMVNAGIYNGDTVIVKSQSTANNGDIVVALLDDGATVKTFFKEKNCVRLQPQNDSMEPIYAQDVQILGVVTGLFRSF